jgi:hypothetical protein
MTKGRDKNKPIIFDIVKTNKHSLTGSVIYNYESCEVFRTQDKRLL